MKFKKGFIPMRLVVIALAITFSGGLIAFNTRFYRAGYIIAVTGIIIGWIGIMSGWLVMFLGPESTQDWDEHDGANDAGKDGV